MEATQSRMLRLEEVAAILGLGKNATYRAAKKGEIPARKIGGIWLVDRRALERQFGVTVEAKEAA